MLEKYKTVYQGGEGETVEKKSSFIATVIPVKTEEEAIAFIESMKKKYWNATHNCSAYVSVSSFKSKDAVMMESQVVQLGNQC